MPRMFDTDDQATYLERAEMHEQLAAATGDVPARKMHQAMAAEYRRKAENVDLGAAQIARSSQADRMMKLDAALR